MAEGTVLAARPATRDSQRPGPQIEVGRVVLGSRRIDFLVVAMSLLVFGYRSWSPSPWRDEAVTLDVTHRSWGELAHLLGRVDLVHAAHYVLMKAIFGAEPGLTEMRFVSVLAGAATAVLLVRLGSALKSPILGIGAASVFIALPLASRYAQEARSYAIVTMLVTAATLALVQATRTGSHRRWALYGLLVVAAAVFHVFSILILAPHAIYVLAQANAGVLVRWTRTTFVAGAVLVPLAYLTFNQRAQVSWIPATQNVAAWLFVRDTFASPWLALALCLAAGYLVARHRFGQVELFAMAWALAPAVALWAISTQEPLFVLRYVAFTVPGAALAIAAVAVGIGEDVADRAAVRRGLRPTWRRTVLARRVAASAAVLATVAAGLGMHVDIRRTTVGHTEDVRGAVASVERVAEPGDGVLFLPYDLRGIAQAYPEAFLRLDDVALRRTAVQTARLFGTEVGRDTLERRLDGHQRIIVLMRSAPPGSRLDLIKLAELNEHFQIVTRAETRPFHVLVYERRH